MRRQKSSILTATDPSELEEPPKQTDWSLYTPYDIIRMQNCKTAKFYAKETYPSIRPPVSKCLPQVTANNLSDAVERAGCKRDLVANPPQTTETDLVEFWKQQPHKEALSCYGIEAIVPQPDAVQFNQLLSKCLLIANDKPEAAAAKKPKAARCKCKCKPPKHGDMCYTLNRDELHERISNMPNVKRQLDHKAAFEWLHCPSNVDPNPARAFRPPITLKRALDMEKPAKKPKHGLRRKHKYCELQCGIPENWCTAHQWKMYQADKKTYEQQLQQELALEQEADSEPRNYDELYVKLVQCFELDVCNNPYGAEYEKLEKKQQQQPSSQRSSAELSCSKSNGTILKKDSSTDKCCCSQEQPATSAGETECS